MNDTPWRDKRIEQILNEADIENYVYQWTGQQCDFACMLSEEEVLTRLETVQDKYQLTDIYLSHPEISQATTHGHFKVRLE